MKSPCRDCPKGQHIKLINGQQTVCFADCEEYDDYLERSSNGKDADIRPRNQRAPARSK